MSTSRLAPRAWLKLPRRTARLRLTILYSGMFMVLGTVLIVIIYLLAGSSSVSASGSVAVFPAHAGGTITIFPGPAGLVPPSVPPVPREFALPVGIAQQQHNADIAHLLEVSWVVLLLTTLGSAVLGWFAAGRVLRPLRSITTTARTISAGSLHQRLALAGPDDEFKQLGDTLDELLARLEGSFESQRRFVANASHELRTPLTIERTLLQVALAEPDASSEKLRATCEEVLATGIEHEQLLESLLTLASSERGLERREPLELSAIAGEAIAAAEPALEHRGLLLESGLHLAQTSGDAALVERLAVNLIDNAVEHNVAGGRVEVTTALTSAGDATLTVTNTGPVVPPGEVARLLEPFQRLGGVRAAEPDGHHGLGLSIVRAIAAAHDATLDIAAPPDGGLSVTVRFPAPMAAGPPRT